jgi:hypothetical protein
MKPVLTIELTNAVPVDGRGKRSNETLLRINERDRYLMEAARFYPNASGDREIARQLRTALLNYRNGRWRRDRAEALCPPQHKGKLVQTLWCLLKTRDAIPGDRTVRAVLTRASISQG